MKILYKLIIWPLVIIFLSQNIAWTAPLNSPQSIVHSPQSLINIHIPESYGRIERTVNCKLSTVNSSKSPTVILIKDAHCNYEAQVNISKILDILIRDYKIDLIGAEGAAGHVNPQVVLESNPAEDIRKKVSDKFLRTGLLTASEALSINKGKEPGFTIWGIEDLRLYLKDYQAFRDTIGISSSGIHFTEITSKLISQLKEKIYPEELQKFDNIIKKYQSNELPLTRFIKIVYCKYGVTRQHQNLKIVLKSMRLEEKIDFGKVEQERTALIKQSEKTLPKEDLQELVKQSLLFKLGKIPAVEYYTYLNGQTINLKRYTRLVNLQSGIDESALFNELEDITEKIYAKLCRDKISHDLHLLDKDINILNKIFSLEATRENLVYFKENYKRFNPENLLMFIKIQAHLYNINLPPEINSPFFIEDAAKSIIPAEEFYKFALQRDTALVENLIQAMNKNKKDKAALVCGGFHADGINKLLQDKGISIITITPSITKIQEDSRELYLKRMMDERIDPEKLLKELGTENVSPALTTSRTGIEIKLHEKIIASFKSYGYEIKQEFTQEEFRKLLPLLKELHNKALEDKNESLKGFIENAVGQSGLEQEFQKLGGDSQEGKPKIFYPEFVRFTPQNLVLRLSNILGNSKELHRLRHVIPKLIKAKKEIRDAEEPSDITGGKAYPYNCQRCANRTVEILERYGFHASIVDIKFAEKMSDKISHHAFVATRINGKDVIVDIAADEFELVEGKENEFLDLGVVILPLDHVKSNQEKFWMYNLSATQIAGGRANSIAQEQQSGEFAHMKSMKLRKGSKYYADRLQINGQDVDINSIKGQISGITSWQMAPAMENLIDEMGIAKVVESWGSSEITVNGEPIRIYKLTFRGKTFYITSDIIMRFGTENFLNIINNALLALQGEGKDISHLPDGICIFNISGSPHLFEDHTKNGFIGVNEALVDLYTNPSTTAEQKRLLSSLLQIGLEHELLHEMGITDESFIAQRDAKRIVEELYTKKGDIEKIKRLIALLLEGDVEIEPDFKVELIIALIERHNRGRPIPNLRKNLNESFNNDKTLKDYLLSFFENGFLLMIDPDDLRKRYIAIEDIRITLDLLLKTARELPPWWVKGKDIVPLIIKFTQGEKLGKMGETRIKKTCYADIPEDITVDCLADNSARTFLHELAHYRWAQIGKPGVRELQKYLYTLLAVSVPDEKRRKLSHELIAEVAATGGITKFLERYKHLLLSGLRSQRRSSQRLELYGAVRLILITHLFRNPEPHPGYTNLHEYTWPYATDYRSIEIMKGWVRHNGEGNWEEVIDERFLSTLKAPGSSGLDEDSEAKEHIEKVIRETPAIEETRNNATFHILNLGNQFGIPRKEGATSPQDLVYALGSNGKIIEFDKATNEFTTESDGKLHIYVTTAFWEMWQGNQLMLDFLIDHEYQEKILGKSHAEASQRAWFFVDKYGMNPFYKFFIDQLAEAKDIDYLRKLLAKHPNDPRGRFRDYVLEILAIKIPYRLQKELDEKIDTEDFNDLLPTLLKLREIHPVIEGLLTENGMLSTLVFEKLENILFDILRVGNVSAKVNLMCITLPIALLNPLGYEVANEVKERFYEKIKGYMAEKKPAEQEERGIRQAYAQLSGQYYGFSKTRLFVVGLNEEDFKDIKRLFKESMEEAGITNPEDYPVYAGHMHVSLKQGLLSLIGTRIAQIIYKILNTQFMQKLFNNLSPFIPKYFVTLGTNIKSSLYRLAKIGNLKGKIHGKFGKDNKEVSIAIEEIIVDAIKEVTGRAEIAEKVLKQNILGSRHKISLFRHRDAIDCGRDKFIPENEYDTGRIPRLSHEMGYLDRLYIGFEVGLGGYSEDEINIDEVMESYKEYKNILNKYILQSLQDTRYRKAYKKDSAGAVIMAWRDGTLKEYIDYLNRNGLEDIAKKWASPLKMTKMGDEIWLYLQKENGEIIQVFVELDKFNAFNEQYPPDARDSFYHQILESIFTHYERVNGQLEPFIEVLEDVILDAPIKIPNDEVYRNGYIPMSKSVEIDWYEKGRKVEIKSVPVLSKPIKTGEWIKLRKLEFHHTEKIKGQRTPVFLARKTGNPQRRVVVYERRIYTDDGKEDITDEILGNGWEISPYVGLTGAAILPDSHSLTNLDPYIMGNLGTYQKKKLRQTYKEPMDALDTIAHQIMSILEKHKIEISDEDKQDLMGDIKRQLIKAYKEKIKIDFMELWKLIEGRIEPKKFFEIAVDISEPLNALLGPEARVRGMHMMNAVLELVLEEIPEKERKEISEDKRLTTEKKILEAMKRIGAKKGIDPNAIQSVFDLFKAGVNILTIDPGLDIGKIDESYFAMIHELEKLIKQETGISEGAIRNAFKKEFGIDAKITDGQIIEGSILWKEVQRLIEYNKSDEGDYDIVNINTNLWHSDFHIGTVIDKANNKRNRYLSALDVVGKDTKSIINLLRDTPVRNSLESKTKVGIIYHIMDYITIHDRGKGTFTFSYRPGIETIFRQMEEGINIVFTTEGIPEEDLQYYEAALKATGKLDKNIFIEESPAGANNRLKNIGINPENIVYVANTEEKAKKAKDLGLKSIVTTKDSSFHASLIFAILYARTKTDEITKLIWYFLNLMGYKDEEIRKVINEFNLKGYFTINLIRIKETLREFQNRKIFIDVAA